ncbi:MAG: hypothetical protein K2X68_14205 [Novosphingobium sp.]|nr:hypothetical protein [Novosphingobium sp.]
MSTFRQKVQATTNWVKTEPQDLAEAPRRSRRARRRPGAPVTAHRLFPAFAILWFAALFGLGSLAVPGSVLGALVLKTGLPALVPAAAPPLGFTAHLLVAFLLAGFGAALGLALALRLAPRGEVEAAPAPTIVRAAESEADDVYKVRARDAHPDAPPRRPLVLTEAFADPLVEEAEPAEPLLRRKSSLPANEPVSEPVSAPVSVPGSASTSDAGPWIPEFTPGGVSAVQPLDLAALDLADPVRQPLFAAPDVAAIEPVEAPAEPEPTVEPAAETIPLPIAPALIAATPQLPVGFSATLPDLADGTWSPVAAAPLESLGLVQLIERLALGIAAQKAASAAIIDTAPDVDVIPAEPDLELELEPEPEPVFAPGPFSQPKMADTAAGSAPLGDVPAIGSAREAILRRLGAMAAGDLTGEAGTIAETAPLFSRPAPVAAEAPSEAVVALRPAAPAFAPPAMTSPPGAAAPLETDEALRSALATLQRMTARG